MLSPKRFAVYWAKSARLDLGSIIREGILSEIEQTASRLVLFPYRGRIVPELKEQGTLIYREVIYSHWRIIYRIEPGTVWVMAVIDGRRNLEDLLLERFLQ